MGQLLGGLGGPGAQHGSTLSLSDLFRMDEDTQVGFSSDEMAWSSRRVSGRRSPGGSAAGQSEDVGAFPACRVPDAACTVMFLGCVAACILPQCTLMHNGLQCNKGWFVGTTACWIV